MRRSARRILSRAAQPAPRHMQRLCRLSPGRCFKLPPQPSFWRRPVGGGVPWRSHAPPQVAGAALAFGSLGSAAHLVGCAIAGGSGYTPPANTGALFHGTHLPRPQLSPPRIPVTAAPQHSLGSFTSCVGGSKGPHLATWSRRVAIHPSWPALNPTLARTVAVANFATARPLAGICAGARAATFRAPRCHPVLPPFFALIHGHPYLT